MSPQRHNHEDEDFQFNEDRPFVASNKNIAVPLWAVVSIVGSFVMMTIYFVNTLNGITNKLDALNNDRWRLSFQREWTYKFEKMNKGAIVVPDPDEVASKMKNN